MLVGALLLIGSALLFERDADVRWTGTAIASVLYLALAGTVVTFGLYFWLMRFAPAYQLSLVAYVIPVIALTLGALVGNEPVGLQTIFGTALVLIGVGFVYTGRRTAKAAGRPRDSEAKAPAS